MDDQEGRRIQDARTPVSGKIDFYIVLDLVALFDSCMLNGRQNVSIAHGIVAYAEQGIGLGIESSCLTEMIAQEEPPRTSRPHGLVFRIAKDAAIKRIAEDRISKTDLQNAVPIR